MKGGNCVKESKSYAIGFSDGFSYGDTLIKYEITDNKELRLYVEDCARALGVTKTSKLKDGRVSETLRYDRVYEDLVGVERIPTLGNFKDMNKDERKQLRSNIKSMTISETELYLWSFRVDGEQGKSFRNWLATIVLPHLREYGIYLNGMEDMSVEEIEYKIEEAKENFVLRKFGIGIRRNFTDVIKENINPSPSESYKYGSYTNIVYRTIFGMDCKEYKAQLELANKDSLRDSIRDSEDYLMLNDIAKAEEVMGMFMMTGVKDEEVLEDMLFDWYENYKVSSLRKSNV